MQDFIVKGCKAGEHVLLTYSNRASAVADNWALTLTRVVSRKKIKALELRETLLPEITKHKAYTHSP